MEGHLSDQQEKEPSKVVDTGDKKFDEAVERVHRKYGSDLSAFVRDVQRDVEKVHKSSEVQRRVLRIDG
jgi:hypothetical protein